MEELQGGFFREGVLTGPVEETVGQARALLLDQLHQLLSVFQTPHGSPLGEIVYFFLNVNLVQQVKNLVYQSISKQLVGE